jgi:methylated-DNA-[protein]-cysteine S-methyltransferase
MQKSWCTYYASPLGNIKLCCSDTCITQLHFLHQEEEQTNANDLYNDAPPVLHQCLEQLIEYFQGQRKKFEVPIKQEGSDFQQRVWNELLNIPFGKKISYLTLAKKLGDPKAIRAAASTNGKNSIAVIVPCHRVIGSNNDMVGYASGIWRKRWLLEMEAKVEWGVQTLF